MKTRLEANLNAEDIHKAVSAWLKDEHDAEGHLWSVKAVKDFRDRVVFFEATLPAFCDGGTSVLEKTDINVRDVKEAVRRFLLNKGYKVTSEITFKYATYHSAHCIVKQVKE